MSGPFGAQRSAGGASACPCGSGLPYAGCCGPLHQGERVAETAEALMRSRYSAFAVGDVAYLVRTWHPAGRPHDLRLDPAMTWTGLEIVETRAGGPDDADGEVEFRASWRQAGHEGCGGHGGSGGHEGCGGCGGHGGHEPVRGVLHERSRFGRRAGRWVYVDGDIRD